MLKRDIQKVFENYIEAVLREDEVYHLRSNPKDFGSANKEVDGLVLLPSDSKMVLATNDFEDFEEDAAHFIHEYFPSHRLKPEDELYRVLLHEYVKATAYCSEVSLKRLCGEYFDEAVCKWQSEHLGSIKGIDTDSNATSFLPRKRGRSSRNWEAIKRDPNRRNESEKLRGKSCHYLHYGT